jgi:hypothetical protein
MRKCTSRLICMEHTIWCKSMKATNEGQHSKDVSSVLWCLLALLMHLPSSTFDEWGISWILGWFCGLLHPWYLIFSKEMEDHEQHICVVLDNLREVWLYVKLEMCEFHQIKVALLGYISFEDGIHKGPHIFYTRWCVLTTWRRLPFSSYQFHSPKCFYATINNKIFDTKLLTIVDTFLKWHHVFE